MKHTFNTFVADLSVAINAVSLYQTGDFRKAINAIQDVLDLEPNNWDARLMLAVCYFKTGQHGAALRAFQLIADKTDCPDIREKAQEGLAVCSNKLDKRFDNSGLPAEFGCYIELFGKKPDQQISWL